jgi:hypothetical protein
MMLKCLEFDARYWEYINGINGNVVGGTVIHLLSLNKRNQYPEIYLCAVEKKILLFKSYILHSLNANGNNAINLLP